MDYSKLTELPEIVVGFEKLNIFESGVRSWIFMPFLLSINSKINSILNLKLFSMFDYFLLLKRVQKRLTTTCGPQDYIKIPSFF